MHITVRAIMIGLAAVLMVTPAGAVERTAQAPASEPTPAPPAPVPPDDPAVQARMPGCAAWTDRCVTCRREGDTVTCSNVGISCQPQALVCLRPEAPPPPAPAADEKKPGN